MPTHRHSICSRWILATCLSACVGTPTPEPPDGLPRPDASRIFGPRLGPFEVAADVSTPRDIAVAGFAGAVLPDSEVWIVNLDGSGDAVSTRARVDGSFRATVLLAQNDRLRIVSRTDTRHSLPLDAHVVAIQQEAALAQLPAEGLPCVTITPAEELNNVVDGKDVTARFTLDSACSDPLSISARLRFGDTGFTIDAPASLPANGAAAITVRATAHDDAREHADIVLLELESGARRARYALGVWSVAASQLGDD